jgi:hypothetical protein
MGTRYRGLGRFQLWICYTSKRGLFGFARRRPLASGEDLPMSSLGDCCCCTLANRPFLTAKVVLFGQEFSVAFAPEDFDEETCCQSKWSNCIQIGPTVEGDCYSELSPWDAGPGIPDPIEDICDQLDATLQPFLSGCCCGPGEGGDGIPFLGPEEGGFQPINYLFSLGA